MPSLPPQVQKVIDDVDKQLHEPGLFTNFLAQVEAKTGAKRLHIVGGNSFFDD